VRVILVDVEAGVVGKASFTTLQSVVALVAGLTSIVGAAYSAMGTFRPPPPSSGEIVVVARDGASTDVVPTAAVEVLATDGTLVTMLPHAGGGVARGSVAAGTYRVRVAHPDFVETVRDVRVVADGTAELQVALAHRPRRAVPRAETTSDADRPSRPHADVTPLTPGAAVDHGIAVGRRVLGRLGF
jgi:hypothetical protein